MRQTRRQSFRDGYGAFDLEYRVMFNLFDILQNQAGPGMQSIGQQFGLTPEQSRSAMNALLPAIAAGLQRSAASDPMGFGRMLGMVGTPPYGFSLSQPASSTAPDFLGQLFGSPMLSQAVLQQASATSGIGQHALKQMLPVMAGMVVAGIVHVLLNQPPQAAAPAPTPSTSPADPGFPMATFWSDWINQFPGFADTAPTEPKQQAAQVPNAPPPSDEPKPRSERPGTSRPQPADKNAEAPLETFQTMFQTGVQVQEQNARAMQELFDAFWSPPAVPAASPGSTEPDDVQPLPPKAEASPARRRKSEQSK